MLKNYFSLIKISHTIFALPFAFIGFWLGVEKTNSFSFLTFLLVLSCMFFARTAAMAFNRYIDREIDAKNPRTVIREIPSQKISANAALGLTIFSSLLFIITTIFINSLCFYLSPVALLVVLGYSYTKRFTSLCHFILGLGLSLAPIGAYIAVTGVFDLLPILYSLLVITWVSGFDILYALQDAEFDRENQLWSIPSKVGIKKSLYISSFLHIISAVILLIASIIGKHDYLFYIGVLCFLFILIRQHLVVKPNDLTKINLAFFTLNGTASILLFLFFILDFYWNYG